MTRDASGAAVDAAAAPAASDILLQVRGLTKHFPVRGGILRRRVGDVKAVDGISFDIRRGETFSLVGESGCGKSTAARTILRLYEPTAGDVVFEGVNLMRLPQSELRRMRPRMQLIYQDPYASLDPRMTIAGIIGEPLREHRAARGRRRAEVVNGLLEKVGLHAYFADRFPHECSGGQRQRVGIARALALNPSLIVCDEPISALDVSVQAQVVNLLKRLQKEMGLTYLFIAHDLSMVRYISHRVGVMYLGRLAELAPRDVIFGAPLHPYTKALLSAVPVPDPVAEKARKRTILTGEIPSAASRIPGCLFHTRCPVAGEECSRAAPAWREVHPGHFVACHLAEAPPG
jgi:oligopeptide transport system ATP-binding protein